MKKQLLVGSVASLLLGLGSCTASFIIPDPSPNTNGSVSNGMRRWNDINSTYKKFKRPDWCEELIGRGDAIMDTTCYIPSYQTQGKQTYDIVWCTFRTGDPSCEYKKDGRSIDLNQAGKLKRFFGEEELLPEEKLLNDIRFASMSSGVILLFVVTPAIFLAYILALVTRKKETSASHKNADV